MEQVQAVIFPLEFTATAARKWLKTHKLKAIKRVDKGTALRYRIAEPGQFKRFFTKEVGDKVRMIICSF